MKTILASILVISLTTTPALGAEPDPWKATDRVPGVGLAEGLSSLTHTAISPLWGVSCLGAWQYFRTSPELRSKLPWFCSPWAWSCGFVLLLLVTFKDSVGAVAPPFFKQPINMAELLLNVVNAALTSTTLVPFIASEIAPRITSALVPHGPAHPAVMQASIVPDDLLATGVEWLITPLLIAAFLIVWLAANIINVLVALSPFPILDSLLKMIKVGLLMLVSVAYFLSPYLGIAFSVVFLVVAVLLAPFAFRLLVFGVVFSYDVLFANQARRQASIDRPHAFVASGAFGVPKRTLGRVVFTADGSIQFMYRPWLVFPPRLAPLPVGTLALAKGVLYPSLLCHVLPAADYTKIVVFLPRYRGSEWDVARYYAIQDVREHVFTRGWRAARDWIAEMIHLGKTKTARVLRV